MKLACKILGHKLSSYSEKAGFDGAKMHDVGDKICSNKVDAIMELAAQRCVRCDYTYKAKTKTDWSLLNDQNQAN